MLLTIGHGNRAIVEFLALLGDAGVECLVDVRAYPASRRNPQFARAALEASLEPAGIRYLWEGKALGGKRSGVAGSPHAALADAQFRAYADHMATPLFREGIERLIETARQARTAIMCAERDPSECHRSFIADAVVARGIAVGHIVPPGATAGHTLNPAARLEGGALIYDAGRQLGLL